MRNLRLCLLGVVLLTMLINSALWAELRLPLGLDLYRPIPEDNPLTPPKK